MNTEEKSPKISPAERYGQAETEIEGLKRRYTALRNRVGFDRNFCHIGGNSLNNLESALAQGKWQKFETDKSLLKGYFNNIENGLEISRKSPGINLENYIDLGKGKPEKEAVVYDFLRTTYEKLRKYAGPSSYFDHTGGNALTKLAAKAGVLADGEASEIAKTEARKKFKDISMMMQGYFEMIGEFPSVRKEELAPRATKENSNSINHIESLLIENNYHVADPLIYLV